MAQHLTPHPGDATDDELLRALAELDPQRATDTAPEQWARSRARLQHLMTTRTSAQTSAPTSAPTTLEETQQMSTQVSTRPSDRRVATTAPRGRRRVVLGLSAAAAAALITAAGAVVPSASTIAYAGSWSAVPTEASAAAGLAQALECASSWQQQPAGGLSAADVLIAERRGDSSVTVVRKDDGAVLCTAIDSATPTGWEAMAPTRAMGAQEVTVESSGNSGTWPFARSTVSGQVGAGVTGIEVLAGGKTVTASVAGGRWVAWWPGDEGGEVGAVQVVIHTASGERTVPSSDLYL
ncbi:hypothetical protein [Quadrisphaera sp. KR29]|uniref:hypothetical protein n=1 Tax=Quadrisphaera sp. KR29 TaxID=3461391 RepID=UPI0040441868